MGWVKLDDGYFRNKKFARIGRAADQRVKDARLLHLAAACWCAEQLTDGVIPIGALELVCRDAGVDESTAKDLVDVEAWHEPGHDCPECPPLEAGWLLHGYLERNPTAEAEERRKAAARDRMARLRKSRSSERSASRSQERSQPGGRGERSLSPSRPRTPGPKGTGGTSSSPQEELEEEDGRLRESAAIIAERRLQRRSPSKDPILDRPKYLRTVAKERLDEHRDAMLARLEVEPDVTAAELADWLEPDLAPPPGPWTACGENGCVDGFVELDDDGHLVIERCACNPARSKP